MINSLSQQKPIQNDRLQCYALTYLLWSDIGLTNNYKMFWVFHGSPYMQSHGTWWKTLCHEPVLLMHGHRVHCKMASLSWCEPVTWFRTDTDQCFKINQFKLNRQWLHRSPSDSEASLRHESRLYVYTEPWNLKPYLAIKYLVLDSAHFQRFSLVNSANVSSLKFCWIANYASTWAY